MRVYKRKTNRKPITEAMLQETQRRKANGESVRAIARDFDVDESSLRARLKRGYGVKSLGRFKNIFSSEQEQELAEHCKQMDKRFYGVTRKMFRKMAYDFAEENNIRHKFNTRTKLAGKDWTQSFLKRHNLSLRTPQKTSLGRIMGFNQIQVEQFYNNLAMLMSTYGFPASRIYNMDESGITTVPNKIPKVIAAKGKRSVNKVTSGERGQLITTVCCFSAGGHYIPPALIFPRKRTKPGLMIGAPPDSILFVSDSGYINSELFVEYLKHFQKHVKATKDSPVLLILDNHSSHCSLDAVLFCRENNIHLLSIPPHSSHRTQPLDRCFFKALKDYYGEYCDQWLVNHPGRTITQDNVAEIFGQSYNKVCTIEKAVNAFRMCGIVPINKFLFTEDDFLPATVTHQSVPQETRSNLQREVQNSSSSSEDDIPLKLVVKSKKICLSATNVGVFQNSTSSAPKSTPNSSTQEPDSPRPFTSKIDIPLLSPLKSTYKSPKELFPYPKISQDRKRMRKGKKSTILTSTPNKEELESEQKTKVETQRKVEAKKLLKKGKRTLAELLDENPIKNSRPSGKEVYCPACDEIYTEPPLEDWIQCSSCCRWWHENCSSYEGGQFLCDLCTA